MQYRPEIDGLRAFAVLPVVLFHAGFAPFSGGYVGVDVFFVISGYLITSILIEDLRSGRFSIARFYERRARRILPALFFVLIWTTVAGWLWMVPAQFEEYSRTLVSVVLFVSNIYIWRGEDYFAQAAELDPLLHTWSLAVEEQFYIVFPILLLAIWRFAGGRLLWTIAALSLMSLLLAEWGWRHAPGANFFLLPTRAWELGAGSICALILRDAPPRTNALLAGLGLGLIVFSVVAFDPETPFPSVYALAPVGGTALVILFGSAGTLVARLLSLRLIVGVGLVSYSAYLWHQPLFAFARIRNPTHPSAELMLALAVAAFALAYVSWRFVEQPFHRRTAPVRLSQRAVFAASGVVAAAFVGVGLYGQVTDGRMQAWIEENPSSAPVYRMYEAAMRIQGVYLDDGACQFNVQALDAAAIERLRGCRQRHGPGVAVLGDSHAIDFFNGMDALHDGAFIFGLTKSGDKDAFASMLRDQPDLFDQVVLHYAGWRYFQSPEGRIGEENFNRIPEDAELPAEDFQVLEQRIDNELGELGYLAGLSEHTSVVWVGPRIEPHIGLNFMLSRGCDYRYNLREGQRALFVDLDRRLADAAAAADVAYVSLIDAMRFDMATDFMTCARLYWRDGDHWSVDGSELFVGRLLKRDLPGLRADVDVDAGLRR